MQRGLYLTGLEEFAERARGPRELARIDAGAESPRSEGGTRP